MISMTTPIEESFRSGFAAKAVEKMSSILSRRLGRNILFSKTPVRYQNDYGQFAGFLMNLGKKEFLKINFLLTKSDSIFSVDFYRGKKSTPDFTIDMEGLNIVQIIDEISTNLDSLFESRQDRGSVVERVDQSGRDLLFSNWVHKGKEEVMRDLQDLSLSVVYNEKFLPAHKQHSAIPFYVFNKMAKDFLFSRGLTNRHFRKRKRGTKERPIEDPIANESLLNMVDNISWEKKFKSVEKATKMVANGIGKSMVLYGSPGSGKTMIVEQTLESLPVKKKYYNGGLKATADLIRILYNNSGDPDEGKEYTVLVFDDFDSVFKNRDMILILKSALDNKDVREITWIDTSKGEKKNTPPPKFLFYSGVIFISNLYKFDSAILSRAYNLRIDLDNDQMLDRIQKTMKDFYPNIPENVKTQAVEFMAELTSAVRTIDYRLFEMVCAAIQVDPSDWKDFALMMISSN